MLAVKLNVGLLTSMTLLLVGCRAPGTYVSINQPFKHVRDNIQAYADYLSSPIGSFSRPNPSVGH